MSFPAMWWGRADDGWQHAVAPCDIAPASDRGWTEALCGWQLPIDVALLSELEDGPRCSACYLGATADVESSPLPALTPFSQPNERP